jgi:hypothetical protein
MSTTSHDEESYRHLCDTVASDEKLQVVHYGDTVESLKEQAARIKKGSGEDEVATASPFAKEKIPVAYYYKTEKQIHGTRTKTRKVGNQTVHSDEFSITYPLNDRSHALCGFAIAHTLPEVRAEKGYRVKWCSNVGSKIARYGEFTHARTTINTFDEITADIHMNDPQFGEDQASIYADLGNLPELQTMSHILPQKTTVYLPNIHFNNSDPSEMFPLYMCSHSDAIDITIIMKSDCRSLIVISREVKDANGNISLEVIKPRKGKTYARFFEDGKEIETFTDPFVSADYAWMSQDECIGNWCVRDSDSEDERKTISFGVNQAFSYKTKNPCKDEVATISKIDIPYPVTQIAWVAFQQDTKKTHTLSNYTTNPTTNFEGSISPIIRTTINNGATVLLDDAPAIQTTRSSTRFSSRRTPIIPGIHTRTFGVRNNDSSLKPGFYFNKGSMDFEVSESDPEVLNGHRNETDDSYIIEVRLFARIEYVFTSYCTSEAGRINGEKSIIARVN